MLLKTERAHLYVLAEGHATRVSQYYIDNADHLDPWEPARTGSFHSRESWKLRGRNAQIEFQQGRSLRLIALSPQSGDMLAACNFTNIQRGPFQAGTLGYSVAASMQGKGLMREILTVGLDYVFNELALHRVMANYIPENERSAALLAQLGFEREGLARQYLKIAGVWRDHVLTAKINPAHLEGNQL